MPVGEAALEVLRVIAAQPSQHWEDGLQDLADRLAIPDSVLRPTLADLVNAWNDQPRAAAQFALRGLGDVKNRLVRVTETVVREHATPAHGARERERHLRTGPSPEGRRPTIDA